MAVDWNGFAQHERRHRLLLPTYPFERQRFWIESGPKTSIERPLERRADVSDWFSVGAWKRATALSASAVVRRRCWLVLCDEDPIAADLTDRLTRDGQHVVTVKPGSAYGKTGGDAYVVRPDARGDYDAVLSDLEQSGDRPHRVLHLWTVGDEECADVMLARGFYSLLALTQAVGERGAESCRIDVVSSSMQQVTAGDAVVPAKATVLGPCKVIPQEYVEFTTRSIDVDRATTAADLLRELVARRETTTWWRCAGASGGCRCSSRCGCRGVRTRGCGRGACI